VSDQTPKRGEFVSRVTHGKSRAYHGIWPPNRKNIPQNESEKERATGECVYVLHFSFYFPFTQQIDVVELNIK
jgi:hypothetical protein